MVHFLHTYRVFQLLFIFNGRFHPASRHSRPAPWKGNREMYGQMLCFGYSCCRFCCFRGAMLDPIPQHRSVLFACFSFCLFVKYHTFVKGGSWLHPNDAILIAFVLVMLVLLVIFFSTSRCVTARHRRSSDENKPLIAQ